MKKVKKGFPWLEMGISCKTSVVWYRKQNWLTYKVCWQQTISFLVMWRKPLTVVISANNIIKWHQHCWNRKLKSLNWTKKNQATSILRNQWKFNPPMVAWWEHLVQIIKKLLRTVPVKSICQVWRIVDNPS
jgi:hypothetical protein